jgi:hypothetical protein
MPPHTRVVCKVRLLPKNRIKLGQRRGRFPTPCSQVPLRFAKRPRRQFPRSQAVLRRRRCNAGRSGFCANSAFWSKLARCTPLSPRTKERLRHRSKQPQRSCCGVTGQWASSQPRHRTNDTPYPPPSGWGRRHAGLYNLMPLLSHHDTSTRHAACGSASQAYIRLHVRALHLPTYMAGACATVSADAGRACPQYAAALQHRSTTNIDTVDIQGVH